MKMHLLPPKEFGKAIGIGILTAMLLSAVMMPAVKFGISPMPKPLGLAFAETVFGKAVPLPMGLLFHVTYVTFWTLVYVSVFRDRLSFLRALWLSLGLWVLVLVGFFPIVGWGLLGLGVGKKLIVASLVPHVLFPVFVWGLCRWSFRERLR